MESARPAMVVTGGGRGIGAATVLALARAGNDVTFAYHQDATAAQRVVAQAERGRRALRRRAGRCDAG